MKQVMQFIGLIAVIGLFMVGCDSVVDSEIDDPTLRPGGPHSNNNVGAQSNVVDGNDGCEDTGTGLSAVLVNEDVINKTVIIGSCDVGAFFDRRGVVRGATFVQPDNNPGLSVQYLVRVEGANVDVSNSEFDVVNDYGPQIVHIGYLDGASGRIVDNTLTGFKRAGIMLHGEGTSGQIRGNTLEGVGPKSTGWAENGIQISGGASTQIQNNLVTDHWWDLTDYGSSGIIIFGSDNVNIQRNTVIGNDLGIVLWGDRNNALHNEIVVDHEDATKSGLVDGSAGFDGITISGDNNVANNNVISGHEDAYSGIFIYSGDNNKLIRNTINGFANSIDDFGERTKLPPPFVP